MILDGVFCMSYLMRINWTAQQRCEIWDRWQRGESMSSIGRLFGRDSSSVFAVLSPSGGIRPKPRKRSERSLSLLERETISRGIGSIDTDMAQSSQRQKSPVSRGLFCFLNVSGHGWDTISRCRFLPRLAVSDRKIFEKSSISY